MSRPTSSQKLAEIIGKGAFGSVYKALNWTTGETVAIKQIRLSDIPQSEIQDIMTEIDLLKNLKHFNIVQYVGFMETIDYLYIILEYCENGSLYSVTKKFGCFPESLVGIYVLQILDGLVYLHSEGVIHRDIKASNILLDKTGAVRLADFGVSTTVNNLDFSVVGSPYWMAPEVVEQRGANSASDIWSLGALVIELLTGKPPYNNLDPLPALFRIVNDDCPPISETFSVGVKDFLLQCFQKDSNLRISAKKLLRHPWMLASKTRSEETKRHHRPMNETVEKVQRWNEVLKVASPFETRNANDTRLFRRPSAALVTALKATSADSQSLEPPAAMIETRKNLEKSDQDNWDEDFADDLSLTKLTSQAHEEEIGSKTLRPSNPPSPVATLSKLGLEDYSDMIDEHEDEFDGKLAVFHLQNSSKKFSSLPPRPNPVSKRSMESFFESAGDDDDYGADFADGSFIKFSTSNSCSPSNSKGDDSDGEDPFFGLDIGRESSQTNELSKQSIVERKKLVVQLLEDIRISRMNEADCFDSLLYLSELLVEFWEELRGSFSQAHGILILVDSMKRLKFKTSAAPLLRLLNFISQEDPAGLSKLCAIGAFSVIFRFISPEYSREDQIEAGLLISSLCRSSTRDFLSIGGVQILTEMVASLIPALLWLAADGISRITDNSVASVCTKNEVLLLLCSSGLVEPLSLSLLSISAVDNTSEDYDLVSDAKRKMIDIILLLSKSEKLIKESILSQTILDRLVEALELSTSESLLPLLRVFKHITMTPECLPRLQKTRLIPVIVGILGQAEAKEEAEIINTLFNFCRMSKERHELVALAGAVPHLLQIVKIDSPLKQFALPIVLDFAHTSASRAILWKFDGLHLYVSLLSETWGLLALESIVNWLSKEGIRVERILLQSKSVEAFLNLFLSKNSTIEELYLRLFKTSSKMAVALSSKPRFLERIVERLSRSNVVRRVILLKLIMTMLAAWAGRAQQRLEGLESLEREVLVLAKTDSVLVRELCIGVLKAIKETVKASSRISRTL